jgi:hypothetical protein
MLLGQLRVTRDENHGLNHSLDPNGAAHIDVRRFQVEPWMASLKISRENQTSGDLCRGRPISFGYFSLRPFKEK